MLLKRTLLKVSEFVTSILAEELPEKTEEEFSEIVATALPSVVKLQLDVIPHSKSGFKTSCPEVVP